MARCFHKTMRRIFSPLQSFQQANMTTPKISLEELQLLLKYYDKDKNGTLSDDEIKEIIREYKEHPKSTCTNPDVIKILKRYDTDGDNQLSIEEVKVLVADSIHLSDTSARYAAYSVGFARAFRYLAFTSDFGEALRPVVSARIVTGTYAVSIGYCCADVGWEAYKLQKRGYISEKGHPQSMSQLVAERSIFQAIASIAVPFMVIHTSVDFAKHVTRRLGVFKRWGPSAFGLCMIPLLPMCLDEPVEHALEWGFERYGPWATGGKSHSSAHTASADKKKD